MADVGKLFEQRIEAAGLALERGDRSEAERLLSESLAMGERHFGPDHPALVVALNELSRLYVRQSAHARAEPLLERLLAIKSAMGEDHPDVATVLAGLAVVRRGLGDDTAAEALYRRALQIREKVLAPNHMAIVITLEHLAETCAARLKFEEALALLQRALPTRESALGAEHATVRALRERIGYLELRVSGETGKATVPRTAPTPLPAPAPVAPVARVAAVTTAPLVATAAVVATAAPVAPAPETPNQLIFIYEPETPASRRASLKRERVMTPQFSVAVAAASLIAAPTQMTPPAQTAPTQRAAPALVVASERVAVVPLVASATNAFDAPRRASRAVHDDLEQSRGVVRAPALAQSAPISSEKRTVRYAPAAAAVAVLAIAAFAVTSYAAIRRDHAVAQTTAEPRPAAGVAQLPTAIAAATPGAPPVAAVPRPDSSRIGSARPTVVAPAAKAPQPMPQASTPALPGAPVNLPTIAGLSIANSAMPNVDSVMRASAKVEHDSYVDQIAPAGKLRTSTYSDDRSETQPVLVGSAPQPRFPEALRAQRMEGDVVVQFLVDATGHVEPSTMKVVRSPHELFTAAVRNVLPRFRFEPARTAPPESKPRAEWVQYSISFAAAK